MLQYRALSVSPRAEDISWFDSGIYLICSSGDVGIKNILSIPIKLKRGMNFAEVRPAFKVNVKRKGALSNKQTVSETFEETPVVQKLVDVSNDSLIYMDTRP